MRFWENTAGRKMAAAMMSLLLLWPAAAALADTEEEQLRKAYQTGQIIRLHILANSDSAEDQRIKYSVRDAVLEAFGDCLAQAGEADAETVYQWLLDQTQAMEETAQNQARKLGFTGKVQAQAGWLNLPEKQYGNVCLPAGRYRGLRIILGQGQGRNWWCVLFPRLCLALAEDGEGTSARPVWQTPRILENWLCLPQ